MTMDESMLLVLPVPFRRQGDALLFEAQACCSKGQRLRNEQHERIAVTHRLQRRLAVIEFSK